MNREDRLIQDGVEGEPLLFYGQRNEHGWASNFSRHGVRLMNPWTGQVTSYRTGEHRYQAMKATDRVDHDWVNDASTPGKAKDRGRTIRLREEWGADYGTFAWYVMFELVLAKALFYSDVKRALLATEDRHMYEDSPTDDIWGWRYENDYRGKNLLGRCWMGVRHVIRAA